MDDQISAAEANRKFSEVLRAVREGRSFVVTAHGKPVAKIAPASADAKERTGALKLLLARLRAQAVSDIGRWSREELYER